MAFLPFYLPGQQKPKIIIIGGGYAGMAAVATFARYLPEASVTVIDPRSSHIKVTHLHETFRYPLEDLLIPFATLEQRFGFRHLCGRLALTERDLEQYQHDKYLPVGNKIVPFDYLLVTQGATFRNQESTHSDASSRVITLQNFLTAAGSSLLNHHLSASHAGHPAISVIGGGATGIQFLFEIAAFLKRQHADCPLRLIDEGERILKPFPEALSDHVRSRMENRGINYYPDTCYLGQENDQLLLQNKKQGQPFRVASTLSLIFTGNKTDNLFAANAFGQILVNHHPLENIFTAGDCSSYQSFGASNAMTAQTAVRKGKLAARNILRHSGTLKLLEPYLHRDTGYVISLGPGDAAGWLAVQRNIVSGMPALVVKELVETQYDLFLEGVDTYLI